MIEPELRRIRAGMVGGGAGADVGKTHRHAMRLDDRYELVAGVFGRDPERSAAFAAGLGIAPERAYRDYREMAEREANRTEGVELVAVVTPNDSHFEIAAGFLRRGIAVVCEKPLTMDVVSAAELVRIAREHNALLAVPHIYSAYAMVRQAARMARDGELGRITYVDVEHADGWAAAPLERAGNRQAAWRCDPAVGGRLSVVGDLGTHAFHLARFVTGLEVERLSARLDTLVPGRRVYDNAMLTLRFAGDVPGRLWASMAATGNNHGLRIRVFGDGASLEWQHEDPHRLVIKDLSGRTTILAQGMPGLSEDASRLTRVGLGHPEGFLEAFTNFYSDVADALLATSAGSGERLYPTGEDGLIGVRLIEAVAASHAAESAWVRLPGDETSH
jgi:predicted dehydrogenase